MGKLKDPARNTSSKFTKAVREQVLESLRAGNFIRTACLSAGITTDCLRKWKTQAEKDPDCEYTAFIDECRRAIHEGEERLVTLISNAAEIDWKAAAHLLARRHAKKWGEKAQKVEVGGKDGAPIAVKYEDARDELASRIARLADRLAKAKASVPADPGAVDGDPLGLGDVGKTETDLP